MTKNEPATFSAGEYEVAANESTQLVRNSRTGVFLGGVGESYFRPWVFPLYAPSGRTVLAAFPHAHPWHNGIFVGTNPVFQGERKANFWGIPLPRKPGDPAIDKVGRIELTHREIVPSAKGLCFRMATLWRDENDAPFLTEQRDTTFFETSDAHICDVTTLKRASFGPLSFPKAGFGGLGIRCEAILTVEAGGIMLADQDRRDASAVHEDFSDYVAYQRDLPESQGGTLGVCLLALDGDRRGPWMVRNFGAAWYNPLCREALELADGATHSLSLRVVAYDGPLSQDRITAWSSLPPSPHPQ